MSLENLNMMHQLLRTTMQDNIARITYIGSLLNLEMSSIGQSALAVWSLFHPHCAFSKGASGYPKPNVIFMILSFTRFVSLARAEHILEVIYCNLSTSLLLSIGSRLLMSKNYQMLLHLEQVRVRVL